MKRVIAVAVVMLCMAATANATMAVYAQIYYPDSTTWRMSLTEVDWNGTVPLTITGYGIASFSIDVTGATTASKKTPKNGVSSNLFDDDPDLNPMANLIGTVGFSTGTANPTPTAGVTQLFAAQNTDAPVTLFRNFGVTSGTFDQTIGGLHPNWVCTPTYNWAAPSTVQSGTTIPGVMVFTGTREANAPVAINFGERSKANIFSGTSGVAVETVLVVPEPATMGLLLLGGLAALRRRR